MTTAPFDRYLASLEPTDSESTKMQKLLAAYNLRKEGSHFVTVRKQDEGNAVAGTWPRGPFADEGTPDEDDEEEDDRRVVDDPGEEEDEAASAHKHFIDVLAGLVVDGSEGRVTRPTALHWLLHHRDGAALVRRLHHKKRLLKKETPMNDTLSAVAKKYGVAAVCKHIVDRGSSNISEHDLVKVVADTVTRLPGETREQAFVRAFSADDEEGLAMRKAVQVLKRHPKAELAPRGGTALAELKAKADALRKQDSSLTEAQAFARVYSAPENVEIAKRERAENRPRAA
jgi:hypothetical protein